MAARPQDLGLLGDADQAADRRPEQDTDAVRRGTTPSTPASVQASCAAPSAISTHRSIRRASFGGATVAGSKPFTSAAIRTGKSLASNAPIVSTPLRPATAAAQDEGTSLPSGVIAPSP